ncbi:hypothetical protein R3P38DRAFT_3187245 [Favolaschia claudopus]|uniref:Uncharacterized protein n=1 Tax=Favolaschia claudopus TaxID=2862362 RepID=A0AAW0BWZ0_9AGAR
MAPSSIVSSFLSGVGISSSILPGNSPLAASPLPTLAPFFGLDPSKTPTSVANQVYEAVTTIASGEVYAGAALTDDLPTASASPSAGSVRMPGPATQRLFLHIAVAIMIFSIVFVVGAWLIGRAYSKGKTSFDEEKIIETIESFKPPTIAAPPRSASLARSDPALARHQHLPQPGQYESQYKMLYGHGRGFFG